MYLADTKHLILDVTISVKKRNILCENNDGRLRFIDNYYVIWEGIKPFFYVRFMIHSINTVYTVLTSYRRVTVGTIIKFFHYLFVISKLVII